MLIDISGVPPRRMRYILMALADVSEKTARKVMTYGPGCLIGYRLQESVARAAKQMGINLPYSEVQP